MPITDIFSKRQQRLRGKFPDIYQYEILPDELRVQIVHIFRDATGSPTCRHDSSYSLRRDNSPPRQRLEMVYRTLCREYGVFSLAKSDRLMGLDYIDDVFNFLTKETDTEKVLDAVEILAKAVHSYRRVSVFQRSYRVRIQPDDAVAELNCRFKEHGVGFQFESGEIIRVDSALLHREVVKPALRFLAGNEFKGANDEFLNAHEHYRHQRYEEALNEALKAMESTLKSILDKRGWQYDKKATARKLIDVALTNNLVPESMQTHFTSLKQGLESGVPTIRNKMGGHGQGAEIREVPEHFVSYHLHLTASVILFLAECDEALD